MSQIKASELLREVADLVEGNRHNHHGPKERSFERIAWLWSCYLPCVVLPEDVAVLMALMKIGRLLAGQPIKDHYMDAAGYMAIAAELADLKEEEDETTDFDYSPGAINFLPNK